MDMKVNKTHSGYLVENSAEEPLLTQPVELVSPGASIRRFNPYKEAYRRQIKAVITGSFSFMWTLTGSPMSFDILMVPPGQGIQL